MTIEAMKQALQAMKQHGTLLLNHEDVYSASLTALRQAIEAAEKQEPYGYFRYDIRLDAWVQSREDKRGVAFYTTPPNVATPLAAQQQWVGLTLNEIDLLEELYAPPVHPDFVNDASHCLELIRHVEAKLKEKNHV